MVHAMGDKDSIKDYCEKQCKLTVWPCDVKEGDSDPKTCKIEGYPNNYSNVFKCNTKEDLYDEYGEAFDFCTTDKYCVYIGKYAYPEWSKRMHDFNLSAWTAHIPAGELYLDYDYDVDMKLCDCDEDGNYIWAESHRPEFGHEDLELCRYYEKHNEKRGDMFDGLRVTGVKDKILDRLDQNNFRMESVLENCEKTLPPSNDLSALCFYVCLYRPWISGSWAVPQEGDIITATTNDKFLHLCNCEEDNWGVMDDFENCTVRDSSGKPLDLTESDLIDMCRATQLFFFLPQPDQDSDHELFRKQSRGYYSYCPCLM